LSISAKRSFFVNFCET